MRSLLNTPPKVPFNTHGINAIIGVVERLKNPIGYTIVELMVVFTVIGILATIGVSNFSNMVAKTRMNQAKSQMTLLYSGMRNFHSEWNQYFGDLKNIDVDLTGELYYRVGFKLGAPATSPACPANYIGPGEPELASATQYSSNPTLGYCSATPTVGVPCYEVASSACMINTFATCDWSNNTFELCACAVIVVNGTSVQDRWQLNEQKQWTHTQF